MSLNPFFSNLLIRRVPSEPRLPSRDIQGVGRFLCDFSHEIGQKGYPVIPPNLLRKQ
jgi:hypothetical protein